MFEKVSYRYALALIKLAEEKNKLDDIIVDFQVIEDAIKSSRSLFLLLENPIINREKKKSILKSIFQNNVSQLSLSFLLLITSKGRENLVSEIAIQIRKIIQEKKNIVVAKVKTVKDFSIEQKSNLLNALQKISNKNVELEFEKEENLKGGFLVRIEDKVWDASVKRQLEKLEIALCK